MFNFSTVGVKGNNILLPLVGVHLLFLTGFALFEALRAYSTDIEFVIARLSASKCFLFERNRLSYIV